jgi:hypothetical protein
VVTSLRGRLTLDVKVAAVPQISATEKTDAERNPQPGILFWRWGNITFIDVFDSTTYNNQESRKQDDLISVYIDFDASNGDEEDEDGDEEDEDAAPAGGALFG